MMNIQEIFQTLKQITLKKAKILEQVAQNKQKPPSHKQQQNQQHRTHIELPDKIEIDDNKTKDIKKQMDAQCKLIETLKLLRKEECEYRLEKKRKMEHKIQIINRIKQQQMRLLQATLMSNQNNNSIYRNTCIYQQQTNIIRQKQEDYVHINKLNKQLTNLQKYRNQKQIQLQKLQQVLQKQKIQIHKLSDAYNTLQNNIQQALSSTFTKKKVQQELQFQMDKLQVQRRKRKKQHMLNIQGNISINTSIRVLQSKIAQQKQLFCRLQSTINKDITHMQAYLTDITNIRQQLKE